MMESHVRTSRRKNLVILRAGDNSLHQDWIKDESRDFDIFVSYYGSTENLHADTADFYEMRRGPKWSCIADLMQANPDFIEQYDSFWFPDDDLASTTANINRMFSFFHAFQLPLGQPALTRDSYYSWSNLLQRDEYVIRYVAFIEVMAPIFDRNTLKRCVDSFSESRSGWGLDWLWPELVEPNRKKDIAIIDATPVKHTRPIGGNLYTNNPELDPRRDQAAIIQKYQLHKQRAIGKYEVSTVIRRTSPPFLERLKNSIRALNGLRRSNRFQK